MPMMKKEPIVFLFNSPLASGCDYVLQTIRIVQEKYSVYGISLGDIISLPRLLLGKDRWITRRVNGALIIRPVSILPGIRFRFIRMVAYMVFAMALRIYVDCRHRSRNKFLWFFEPFHVPPLLRMFQGYITLYDCVDYYPGFSKSAKREHTYCMRVSRFVFANSVPLAAQLKKQRGNVRVAPLGFAPELFTSFPMVSIPPNKKPFTVGFIGSISDRMDFPLLYNVIKKLPSIQFMFAGPLERNVFGVVDQTADKLKILLRYPNVTWMPEVPKHKIPSILRHIDVGIIPYRNDLAFNRYSFPMKVLEYFAVGRPVISTDILALRDYADKGLLEIIHTPKEFVRAIRVYQTGGWSKQSQYRQRKESAPQSWERKISVLLQLLTVRHN